MSAEGNDPARVAEIRGLRSRRYERTSVEFMTDFVSAGCVRAGLSRLDPVYYDRHAATWIILTDDESAILAEIDPRSATVGIVEDFVRDRLRTARSTRETS